MKVALSLLIFGVLSAAAGASLWYYFSNIPSEYVLLWGGVEEEAAVGLGLTVLGCFSIIGGIAILIVKRKR